MSDSGPSAFASVLPVGGVGRFGLFGPKLSTPSTGSPRSGLTRQTLSLPSTFRSGVRPNGSERFPVDRGIGGWGRPHIRAHGWCSWRSDVVSDWAEFVDDGRR